MDEPSALTYLHIERALHLATCVEALLVHTVAEMSARRFEALVLVTQEDVVALRAALHRMRAVWDLEEEV